MPAVLFCLLFIFRLCGATLGVLVSRPGTEPMPLQWKHGILTTGLPGKSEFKYFLNEMLRRGVYLFLTKKKKKKKIPHFIKQMFKKVESVFFFFLGIETQE